MEHALEKSLDGRWNCSICQWHWKSKPQSQCPNVPRYIWQTVPLHLKTQTELRKIGLKPAKGERPSGCVYSPTKTDYYWLYDVAQVEPKPKATRAQLAALDKARSLLNESVAMANAGRGALESYKGGLIEVRPTDPDYRETNRYPWYLAAIHLPDGDAYQGFSYHFSTHLAAIKYGKKVFDWIVANSKKITYWGGYTGDRSEGGLGITLQRRQREYPQCSLPYFYYLQHYDYDEPTYLKVQTQFGQNLEDAIAAGYVEAIELPYYIERCSKALVVVCNSKAAAEVGWADAWSVGFQI
ncbi:MAG: hypothetical protein MUC48_05040 [Leptolyngbya sp. Prado105]|jgi:rubredoxin|nr:hypothetical protein [Leptolyngbya sp. Prado105]